MHHRVVCIVHAIITTRKFQSVVVINGKAFSVYDKNTVMTWISELEVKFKVG